MTMQVQRPVYPIVVRGSKAQFSNIGYDYFLAIPT